MRFEWSCGGAAEATAVGIVVDDVFRVVLPSASCYFSNALMVVQFLQSKSPAESNCLVIGDLRERSRVGGPVYCDSNFTSNART